MPLRPATSRSHGLWILFWTSVAVVSGWGVWKLGYQRPPGKSVYVMVTVPKPPGEPGHVRVSVDWHPALTLREAVKDGLVAFEQEGWRKAMVVPGNESELKRFKVQCLSRYRLWTPERLIDRSARGLREFLAMLGLEKASETVFEWNSNKMLVNPSSMWAEIPGDNGSLILRNYDQILIVPE